MRYWVGYSSLRIHGQEMGQYNSKQSSKWEVFNWQLLLVSWFLGSILSHRVNISLCISELNALALLLAFEEDWVPRHRAAAEPLCGGRNPATSCGSGWVALGSGSALFSTAEPMLNWYLNNKRTGDWYDLLHDL